VPRVGVIGAGPSGITAVKNLLQAGLRDVVAFERSARVGGNWAFSPGPGHSSVFETTHIISSRTLSQYEDHPFPEGTPDYPGHRELLAYFEGYARRFGVLPHVRFGTEVVGAVPDPAGGFSVTLGDGTVERFDHLLVANGHHSDPRMPDYPGTFAGELLHAHDYKTSAPFRDKRVLVVGGGNSGCDIAVETARVSAFTAISMRRGYHFVPKFLFGLPSDVLHARIVFVPRPLRARLLRILLRLVNGSPARYGLEPPDHELLETHPVVNSELLYSIRHGRVHPRRDVVRFEGRTVHFADGRAEEYDVVIAATGYRISFPFLDRALVDFSAGPVPLYLRVFPPRLPGLYFIGLCQPTGCIWPLADLQSRLVASLITGRYALPPNVEARIAAENRETARDYMATPRHTLEVDYHAYRQRLLREIPTSAPRPSSAATPS
jgi:NADPH-dependent 2,4-dienoyl-CoA reductase/sulfur reductase-like enzyme